MWGIVDVEISTHHPVFAIAECIYITNRKLYYQNVVWTWQYDKLDLATSVCAASGAVLMLCVRFAGCSPQTGHATLNSTPYQQLENQAPNTTDRNHLYNTLELLMMGIKVPRNMLSKQ
jgi:hypothetical protein